MAFLPIEVILISFILEKYLNKREKQVKFRKLQVVISAFYADVGTSLNSKLKIRIYWNMIISQICYGQFNMCWMNSKTGAH